MQNDVVKGKHFCAHIHVALGGDDNDWSMFWCSTSITSEPVLGIRNKAYCK